MSKQFSEEKGTRCRLCQERWAGCLSTFTIGTVRRALALAEHSGTDTVAITISLERLVSLAQTLSCLVGQQLDEAVGHENMSSDEEPGAGSGNRGWLLRRQSL